MFARRVSIISMIVAIEILIISFFFVGGYLLGKSLSDKRLSADYQKKIDGLESSLETLNPPLPEKLTRLNGQIIQIGVNSLQIKANVKIRRLPEGDQPLYSEQIKTVKITPDTEIFQLNTKAVIRANQPTPTKTLTLSQLKVGQNIVCESSDDIDLKSVDAFTAKSVELIF